jgi:TonB family protein
MRRTIALCACAVGTLLPAIGLAAAAPTNGSRPVPPSKWTYTQDKDVMRGTTTYFARLQSDNALQFAFPYSGGARGALYVRDKLGELNILLTMDKGQFLCSEFSDDTVAVKFDDGPVEEFTCSDAADGSTAVIFIEPEEKFLAELRTSTRLILEAPFFQEGRKQLTFQTRGIRWDHNQPSQPTVPDKSDPAAGIEDKPAFATPSQTIDWAQLPSAGGISPIAVMPPSAPTPPVALTSHAITAGDYPAISLRLQEQGVVAVRYLIAADGSVVQVNVVKSSGSQRLDDAAVAMVKRRWMFKPGTQDGKPVATWHEDAITFRLQ